MHPTFRPTALSLMLGGLLSAPFPPLYAAEDGARVVVTASRQAQRVEELLADVTVIDREAIERAGTTNLPDLLSRQPGLQLVNNGGTGKASSIFIRGANSGHTLLLIDGMPVGSATLGAASLTNIPLSQIERVEILRGAGSSLYGSDAIGGVIQIFTRTGAGDATPTAFATLGSDHTREVGAGVSGSRGPWSYAIQASRLSTDGFNVAADPTRFATATFAAPNPDDDGYRNLSWSGRLAFRPARGHEIGGSFLKTDSRNHYDRGGVAVDAYSDDRVSAYTLYSANQLTSIWKSTLRLGQSEDRSEDFSPARSLFATKQKQWMWQNDIKLPIGSLMFAAEELRQSVDSTTAYTVTARRVRSYIAGYSGFSGDHNWQASLRRDDNSQFGGKTTGNIAYGYRFAPQWQGRVAYGTAFKAPSFNQLYFPGFGSPTLRPELAKNREVGLAWEDARHRAGVVYFDNRITDLIAGFPVSNIGRARITGTSLTYGLSNGPWQFDTAVDLMKPIDESTGNRLQRRAARLAKLSLRYVAGSWSAGGELNSAGQRYDTATQTRPLGAYEVVNLFGNYRLGRNLVLEGRVNNLLDRQYETAWSFAQPGRSVYLGIRYAPR